MIRREIQLPGEEPQWLLISQVEHARISGLIAKHSLLDFSETIRAELLRAIVHHDDGWATWDAQPQIDAVHRRPPSFRELPLEVSLPIWTVSIEAAARIGPLALWVVSGHFLALLKSSEKPIPSFATDWEQQWITPRTQVLSVWQALNPDRHTQALADKALSRLQLFDVMSLWLCNVCPGLGESVSRTTEEYSFGEDQPLETRFCYEQGRARIEPWRFDVPNLRLEATGWTVPVREYDNAEELFSTRVACSISWLLSS